MAVVAPLLLLLLLLSGNLPQFTDYLSRVHFPSVSVSLTVDFCSPVCVCLCACVCVILMTMARTKIWLHFCDVFTIFLLCFYCECVCDCVCKRACVLLYTFLCLCVFVRFCCSTIYPVEHLDLVLGFFMSAQCCLLFSSFSLSHSLLLHLHLVVVGFAGCFFSFCIFEICPGGGGGSTQQTETKFKSKTKLAAARNAIKKS